MDNSFDENHANIQINTMNTIKRQCPPIKYVNITPIRLSDIQKELEESSPPSDNQKDDNSLSPIVEVNETSPVNQISFECDLDRLSSFDSSPIDDNKENQQPTKIQCTISLKDLMQTPRNGAILNSEPKLLLPYSFPKRQLKNDFKRLTINRIEYIIWKQLGKGGSSEVFLGFNQETESQRAIKCVSLKNPTVAQDFLQEVKILKQLQNCDRIIKLYDYEINNKTQMLLMVLEAGGDDLSTVLKNLSKTPQHLPKYKLICYWMEILYAVKQIHSHGIIHTDLKPANFLQFNNFQLKLIDFGISTCIQEDVTSVFKTVAEGSLNYISPEALNNQDCNNIYSPTKRNGRYKISFKSDVWSLGCILYQLVYKRTPFQHIGGNILNRMRAICDPEYKISYPPAPWVPKKIIETIQKCLQHNMKLRPTVDELIKDCENL